MNRCDKLAALYDRLLDAYLFRGGDNPYKERKNKLTPRQQAKRKRMMKHIKKGKK